MQAIACIHGVCCRESINSGTHETTLDISNSGFFIRDNFFGMGQLGRISSYRILPAFGRCSR